MFLEAMFDRTPAAGMEKLAAFTEARHAVLADNVANFDTPGYRAKRLSLESFQKEMGDAMARQAKDPAGRFVLRPGDEFAVDAAGSLRTFPTTEGRENILLHDGTAASVEREMAEVAKNGMLHKTAMFLLKGHYDGLMKAVRQKA